MDASVEGDLFAVAAMLTGIDVEDLGAEDPDGAGPDARATALRQATLLAGCLWKASIVVEYVEADSSERRNTERCWRS